MNNDDMWGETPSPEYIVSDFTPEYARWRHGGWYVTNVEYPSGAIGCVSNNYPDRKWRIVNLECVSFPSRDAAARAEYAAIEMMKKEAPERAV